MICRKIHLTLVKAEPTGECIHDIWHPMKSTMSLYHGPCVGREISGGQNVWLTFREMRKELDEYVRELEEKNGSK